MVLWDNWLGRTKGSEVAPGALDKPLRPAQLLVMEALSCSAGLTRTALMAQLHMPKATVTGVVDSLVEMGLIVERPLSGRRRQGRPPKVLSLAGPRPVTGAVVMSNDILRAAVVSYAGEVLASKTMTLAGPETFAAMAAAIKPGLQLLDEAIFSSQTQPGQLDMVVLGAPAPLLKGPASTGRHSVELGFGNGHPARGPWLHIELAEQLERHLGTNTLVENDANLGALGEAAFGAGRGQASFMYLKLAHGVGAGIVIDGRLHRGANGFAGEIAHVHARDDGPLCACGGRGCLHRVVGDALVSVVQPAYERELTLRDVLEMAAEGDPGPRRVLEDLGRTIGRHLADFVTLFNPSALIVDGSFAPAVEHVICGVQDALVRYASPVALGGLAVIAGELGDRADVLGAAELARTTRSERLYRPVPRAS